MKISFRMCSVSGDVNALRKLISALWSGTFPFCSPVIGVVINRLTESCQWATRFKDPQTSIDCLNKSIRLYITLGEYHIFILSTAA